MPMQVKQYHKIQLPDGGARELSVAELFVIEKETLSKGESVSSAIEYFQLLFIILRHSHCNV
jgi:hypothetical protein